MTFLYPLGLLGLIGIPILIIIYIIKNKYTEQTIASTYLWTLSERFLKRKNPINKLAGLISLILQILIVALLSFGIAHPVFTMHGMAERYTLILDCSGSMRIEQDGSTRFELAKRELQNVVNSSVKGSTYTFICAGDVSTVYETTTDKDRILSLLESTEVDFIDASMDDALLTAQEIFNDNTSTITYLFTDKDYEDHNNVNVVNVAQDSQAQNYAIYGVTHEYSEGNLVVAGAVISFSQQEQVTVRLTIDDGQPYEVAVPLSTGTGVFAFAVPIENEYSYNQFTIEIVDDDALALDNSVTYYSVNSENTQTALIVTGDKSQGGGFYIENLVRATGIVDMTVMTEDEYSEIYLREGTVAVAPSGYGLYIFNEFNPQVLPSDGTVWLIGLDENLPDASFSVQGEVDTGVAQLEYSTSTSSLVRQLLENLVMGQMYTSSYIKCSPYRNYTTLISYRGNPVVFVTQTAYGNREVVFAFNFADTDTPLTADLIMLVRNLIDYSFPAVVEETLYECGETAIINVVSGTSSIRLESPSGEISYLDTANAQVEVQLSEVGTYNIIVSTAATQRTYRIYSSFPITESETSVTEAAFSLTGQQTYEGYDGLYDDLLYLVIILAVIFLADWVVYCYEQYQLR